MRAAGARPRRAASTCSVELGPVTLPNPIVAASGTFGHGAEVARAVRPARLGAVTVKSVAAFAWAGNPPLRVAEAPGGGMLNSVGLPGPGVDAWIAHDLPALEARGARVIASIWGRTVDDYAAAARTAEGGRAIASVAVEVNLSCPNVEARRDVFAHSADATRDRDRARSSTRSATRCPCSRSSRRTSPTSSTIARAARRRGRDRAHAGQHGDGSRDRRRDARAACSARAAAGLTRPADQAGRAARGVGRRARAPGHADHRDRRRRARGEDAVEMLLAGATAVGVGTATFADPRATLRIVDELDAWCAAQRRRAASAT